MTELWPGIICCLGKKFKDFNIFCVFERLHGNPGAFQNGHNENNKEREKYFFQNFKI